MTDLLKGRVCGSREISEEVIVIFKELICYGGSGDGKEERGVRNVMKEKVKWIFDK